jgi:hypothetical protein
VWRGYTPPQLAYVQIFTDAIFVFYPPCLPYSDICDTSGKFVECVNNASVVADVFNTSGHQ